MPLKEDALRRNRVVDTASREGRTLSISETLPGPAGVGRPWRKTRLWARDLGGRRQVQERTTQTHVTSPLGGRGRKLVSKDTEVKVLESLWRFRPSCSRPTLRHGRCVGTPSAQV